jgi:hypothetical protein
LYTRKTKIHVVKSMIETMVANVIGNILQILLPTIWAFFAVYAIWYSTSAKCCVPITRNEARALWHIHKQNAGCNGKKCKEIKRGGNIVGFECTCGYRHFQKRPIVGSAPASSVKFEDPECSAFDSLHTTYKSD